MKLQVLIPQYKETDEVISTMLDSLKIQQNVDFNEFGVVICNDGSDVLLSESLFDNYPFKIEYYKEPHRGVSGTRNACLDHSVADYVMFCDADDMFVSACGLYIIFQEIDREGGFKTLSSLFVEEARFEGKPFYVNHENDATFVHGKVHNRKFLIDNNIRWNEKLTIHEDSFFNVLTQTVAGEIKYSNNAFYLWRWRDDSVCRHDPKYILKTYNNMLDSNTALVEEFLNRNMADSAKYHATNMIYEAYFTLNKQEWIDQENQEYRRAVENRFKKYYSTFKILFDSTSDDIKHNIISGIKNRMFREGMFLETITFNDWIKQIESQE